MYTYSIPQESWNLFSLSGSTQVTKRDGEYVAIEKLNTHQPKKLMVVCKTPLVYLTKQTTELQKKIQEFNNLLENSSLTKNNVWAALCGTMWYIIKYVLPVTTLSKSEVSNLTVYLYMEMISRIGAVKYLPLCFLHAHPKYQGLVFPIILLEHKISKIGFLLNQIHS